MKTRFSFNQIFILLWNPKSHFYFFFIQNLCGKTKVLKTEVSSSSKRAAFYSDQLGESTILKFLSGLHNFLDHQYLAWSETRWPCNGTTHVSFSSKTNFSCSCIGEEQYSENHLQKIHLFVSKALKFKAKTFIWISIVSIWFDSRNHNTFIRSVMKPS